LRKGKEMRNILRAGVISVAVLVFAASANAADIGDMVGKWKWTDYTIGCKAGSANGISCIVIDGPKNKGMEMVQSKPEPKDGAFTVEVKHPATGYPYKATMVLKDADNWEMDGCVGVFTRIK
jgi:uncharacterized protein (DUF2147 family)